MWGGAAFAAAVYGNFELSGILIICGMLSVVFSRVEEVSELSVGSLKLKLKDALIEAHATVEQLRNLAVDMTKTTLALMAPGTTFSIRRRFDYHRDAIDHLKALGVNDVDIALAEEEWKKAVTLIYIRIFYFVVGVNKPGHMPNAEAPLNRRLASDEIGLLTDYEQSKCPSPDAIKIVLNKHGVDDPQVLKWVGYYEEYLKSGKVSELDEFCRYMS